MRAYVLVMNTHKVCDIHPKVKPMIINASPMEQSLTNIFTTVLSHLASVRISIIYVHLTQVDTITHRFLQ